MAAGEEDGSAVEPEQEPAVEPEQEPAAEEPRSFKDLVRLGQSRFCPRCRLPCPEEQCPASPARMRPGEVPGGPCAAGRHVRRSAGPGAGLGRELRALGPAAVGMAAPIAAPQPAAAAFELF